MPDNKRKLYDVLSKDYDLGSFEQFSNDLNDEEKRKKAYEAASASYDVGDFDKFSSDLGIAAVGQRADAGAIQQPAAQEHVASETEPVVRPLDAGGEAEVVAPLEQTKDDDQYTVGFWKGISESGWPMLREGFRSLAGEVANLVTGSSRDEKQALEEMNRRETDKLYALAPDHEYAKAMTEWQAYMAAHPDMTRKERRRAFKEIFKGYDDYAARKHQELVDEYGWGKATQMLQQDLATSKRIAQAVEETNGSVPAAKRLLERQAEEQTWGDQIIDSAAEEMAQIKPTKGFGAWAGSMIPQMVPSAAAMAIGIITKNPRIAQAVGTIGMGGIVATTAGSSMAEARANGATDAQTWGVGLADGITEFITEKIPFDRYTKRVFAGAKGKMAQELGEALAENPSARKELNTLLGEANKKLGGKLLSGKNVKDFAEDVLAEGLSEFAAEAIETITPMIYLNPEDYPTLGEIVKNGWEGMKGGLFMGAILGGSSKTAEHFQNRNRRKEQGYVDVAVVDFGGEESDGSEREVVEIVGRDKDGKLVTLRGGKAEAVEEGQVIDHVRYTYDEFSKGELEVQEDEAYDNGYTLETPQEQNDASNMFAARAAELKEATGRDDLTTGEAAALIRGGASDEQVQVINDYLQARATYEGMINRAREEVSARLHEINSEIDSNTNTDTGTVIIGKMKGEDDNIHIVSGNIAYFEDGTLDLEKSDESIIVRRADGKLEMVSPKMLDSAEQPLDPAVEKSNLAEQVKIGYAQDLADRIDGVLHFAPGDVYSVLTPQGKGATATVVVDPNTGLSENPDGTINVSLQEDIIPGQEAQPSAPAIVAPIPKEMLQQMSDASAKARLDAYINYQRSKQQAPAADNTSSEESKSVQGLQKEEPKTALERIPVRDDGTLDFEAATVKQTWEALIEMNKGDEASSVQQATESARRLQAEADELSQQRPRFEEDATDEEKQAALQEWQQEISELTAKATYWKQVASFSDSEEYAPKDINGNPIPTKKDRKTGKRVVDGDTFMNSDPVAWAAWQEALPEGDRQRTPLGVKARLQGKVNGLTDSLEKDRKALTALVEKGASDSELEPVQDRIEEATTLLGKYNEALAPILAAEQAARDAEVAAKREEFQAKLDAAKAEEERKQAALQQSIAGNDKFQQIQQRFTEAKKHQGSENLLSFGGQEFAGRYYLVEADAPTASHQPTNGWIPSEGFPVDETGRSLNTRDYEHEKRAQEHVEQTASNYDSRAIQHMVVVTSDGIVVSGNERTMASQLAAQQGTDGKYVDYLKRYANLYGFTPEQVAEFEHPRVVFVPDAPMEYTAKLFDAFNKSEEKRQDTVATAAKVAKITDDKMVMRIADLIGDTDDIQKVYQDPSSVNQLLNVLEQSGVITKEDRTMYVDAGGKLTGAGEDILESVLFGSVFSSSDKAVRNAMADKSIRRAVAVAFPALVRARNLGGEYSIIKEMTDAVSLLSDAKTATKGVGGERALYDYMHQFNLFSDLPVEKATVQLLANILASDKYSTLRAVLNQYLDRAALADSGQIDMMTGDIESKEQILRDVLEFNNINIETYDNAKSGVQENGEVRDAAAEQGGDGAAAVRPGAERAERLEGEGNYSAEGSGAAGQVETDDQGALFEEPANPVVAAIAEARKDVDTDPSDAQKEAGNYRKGHVRVDGFDISIENPKGSVRSGTDAKGNRWETQMNNDYGYIRGTQTTDGDHIDIFLSDDPTKGSVFVVDQVNPETGEFDEHKVMYGFPDVEAARAAYLSNYDEGWQGLGNITEVSKEDFKGWLDASHRKTKPFADYAAVKAAEASRVAAERQQAIEIAAAREQKEDSAVREILSMLGTTPERVAAERAQAAIDQNDALLQEPEAQDEGVRNLLMEERAGAIQDMIDQIGGEATAVTRANVLDVMAKDGQSEQDVAAVRDELELSKIAGYKLRGFRSGGKVYLLADDIISAEDARSGYVHERQHGITAEQGLVGKLLEQSDVTRDELAQIVRSLSGTTAYDGDTTESLANEALSMSMEVAYAVPEGEIAKVFERIGVANESFVKFVENLNNEQRNNEYLRRARRSALRSAGSEGAERQDVGAQGSESGEVQRPGRTHESRSRRGRRVEGPEYSRRDRIAYRSLDAFGRPSLPLTGSIGANTTEGSILFSRKDGSLVGIHNISADKLAKAIKMGGLANPSSAVIDIEKQDHFNYGEISLIMPSSLVNSKTGRNIGTFDRDAWTPSYPNVEYFRTKQTDKRLNELTAGLPDDLGYEIRKTVAQYMDGDLYNSGLEYLFLKEKGEEPEIQVKPRRYPYLTLETIWEAIGVPADTNTSDHELWYDAYEKLSPEQRTAVNLLYFTNNDPKDIAYRKERAEKNSKFAEALARHDAEMLSFATMDSFVYNVMRDARDAGEQDLSATIEKAVQTVREKGYAEEFGRWQDKVIDSLAFDEKIFIGYRSDGTRIYKPNTLENVSAYMKKQGRNASKGHGGEKSGTLLAKMARKFTTLAQIRDAAGSLTNIGDDRIGDIHKRIGDSLFKFYDYDYSKWAGMYSAEQDAFGYIEDILVFGKDPDAVMAEFNSHTKGEKRTLTDEDKAELSKLREDMMNIPVHYFETKFERPVMLNEFAGAVVPQGTSPEVMEALEEAGLPVYEYDKESDDGRRKATLAATKADGVLFSKAYHGTAADFNAFDHSHMGEGEGAQAFGWGTYVTEEHPIAVTYAGQAALKKRMRVRRPGSSQYDFFFKGQLIDMTSKSEFDPLQWAWDLVETSSNMAEARRRAEKYAEGAVDEEIADHWREVQKVIKDAKKSDFTMKRSQYAGERIVYSVDIPDDNGTNYLNWREIIEEDQLEGLLQRLKDAGALDLEGFDYDYFAEKCENAVDEGMDGEGFYERLARVGFDNDPKAASQLLNKAGFVGIKYEADNGRSKKFNYVIFNEADAKISDKVQFSKSVGEIRDFLLSDNYVSKLTGEEFAKDGEKLTDKVDRYYKEKYDGKVTREGLGEVLLDKRGVRDSIAHGIGRTKSAAFAAVPEIITDGVIIDSTDNFEGKGYASYKIAAPISIGEVPHIGVVIINEAKSKGANRFYLHEAIIRKNLQDEEFKTGMNTGSHQGDVANILKNIVNAKDDDVKFSRAYHGSRANFDRFDHSHMGEGEGAQAHGWGSYVAFNKRTASRYAERFGGADRDTIYGLEQTAAEQYARYRELVKRDGEQVRRLRASAEEPGRTEEDRKGLLDTAEYIATYGSPEQQQASRAYDSAHLRLQIAQNAIQPKGVSGATPVEELNDLSYASHMMSIAGSRARALEMFSGAKDRDERSRDRRAYEVIERSDETDWLKTRNLYTVEVPDDNGHNYIVENETMSEDDLRRIYDALLERSKTDDVLYLNIPIGWDFDQFWNSLDSTNGDGVYWGVASLLGNKKLGGPREASLFFKSLGYVGMKYYGYQDQECAVMFDEGAIEITDHIRFSRSNRSQEVFVSNAASAAGKIKMDRATPEQWLKMLEKEGGLKAGEDKWLGLSDWLKEQDKKTISKQEVLDFIEQNKIRIEEQDYSEDVDVFQMMRDEIREKVGRGRSLEEIQGEIDELVASDEYKEMFDDEARDKWLMEQMRDRYGDDFAMGYWIDEMQKVDYSISPYDFDDETFNENIEGTRKVNSTRASYTTNGLEHKREIALTVPSIEPWNAGDKVHFGDAGEGRAIAWIRFGDTYTWNELGMLRAEVGEALMALEEAGPGSGLEERADAAKKALADYEAANPDKRSATNRVLVIDEIQSKRHQTARERGGYKDEEKIAQAKERVQQMMRYYGVNNLMQLEEAITSQQHYDDLNEYKKLLKDVPAAPFEKNWHELAMKRMLRYAAENGYDIIAWTTGEQQAERYNIGDVVGSLYIDKRPDEENRFVLLRPTNSYLDPVQLWFNEQGMVVSADKGEYENHTLAEIFGKDIAVKIMSSENGDSISGDGLRAGGQGMKGFYDETLPRWMNKYGKQWGVSVKDVELPNCFDEIGRPLVMHSVDVNLEMQNSVLDAQPMFSRRGSDEGFVQGELFTLGGEPSHFVSEGGLPAGTGRTSIVERTYRKTGAFSFTGKNKIETAADVAYIFKELETAAVENSFLVMVKDGVPTILHTGVGSMNKTQIDELAGIVGKYDFNPDEVYLVHNHPSGSITASRGDVNTIAAISEQMGKIPVTGIIIDTLSGEYGVFDRYAVPGINDLDGGNVEESQEDEIPLEVLAFDKLVFSPDFRAEIGKHGQMANSKSIAAWLSAHRLGSGQKVGALLIDTQLHAVGSVVLNANEITRMNGDRLAEQVVYAAAKSNANHVVLFGDFQYDRKGIATFKDGVNRAGVLRIDVLDVVRIEGNNTRSMHDKTLSEAGPDIDTGVRFSRVTDPEMLERLESEPTIKVYRAMQVIDGKLYPPMAAKVDGRLQEPIELGVWEQADERPEMADKNGNFTLNKGNGKSLKARYNPYIHTSRSPLNDQFTSAYDRPNLVTVEVEVPESELTSGYKAEKAKDAVGEMTWHSGPVSGKLPDGKKRKVILSRWDKPVRIVPDSEVAEKIAELLEGENITIPYNVVTPSLREELEKKGVQVSDEPSGTVRFSRAGDEGGFREAVGELVTGYDNQDGTEFPWMSEGELLDRFQEEIPYGRDTEHLYALIDKYNRLDEADFEEGRRDFSGSEKEEVFEDFLAALREYSGIDEPGVRYSRTSRPIDEIVSDGRQAVAGNSEAAGTRLAERIKAIDARLSDLRKAASAQRDYDRATVDGIVRLAQDFLKDGSIANATRAEVSRLLSVARSANGRKDPAPVVNDLMDLMIGNQLRYGRDLMQNLLKTQGSKVDAKGVEVQGKMDSDGQKFVKIFRSAIALPLDSADEDARTINNLIEKANEKISSSDDAVAAEGATELAALRLAADYVEKIRTLDEEEDGLREALDEAKEDFKKRGISPKAYREYRRDTEDAIRQSRMDRIDAYREMNERLAHTITRSIAGAKLFNEAEKERVRNIQHLANADMEGRSAEAHKSNDYGFANNPIVRFFLKPLSTFDTMLRYFGAKSPNGEGFLYNHFMRAWNEARDKEVSGLKAATDELDRKASEVFGRKMRWSDLYSVERKMPTVTVKFWDDGMKEHKLTQGNLLYIYMVNKMSDGRMKLRKMGIDQDTVNAIVRQMDPRFIELADWLQSDFLVRTRNKYNRVHEEMFGAPMAAIEDYFPLKINANSRQRAVDLGIPDTDGSVPSTTTGSIIKRRRNSLALDVTNADAFSVTIEHLQKMENWAAFAPMNRDLNTLLSYRRFRNQVQNMKGIHGSGSVLWNGFKDAARIATGVYHPAVSRGSIDAGAVNIAKGVTAAKVSFRLHTAVKQLLSMPAFLTDTSPKEFAKSFATPWKSWNWCMENLPVFKSRWLTKQAGDSRLMKTDADWKMWRQGIVETASRLGMTPNAFVDALTISVGAKAVYETKYAQHIKDGRSKEDAARRAKQDAVITFNETQQSNEGAFLSAMQLDRTWASTALTVFRNSSMGYGRRFVRAVDTLGKMVKPGYKKESIDFMTKQMIADGIDEQDARGAAERAYTRAGWKAAAEAALFGFGVQFSWNLGAFLPYLLAGDDDDDKLQMIKDAFRHSLVGGWAEGFTAGNVASEALDRLASGEGLAGWNPSLMPLTSDLLQVFKLLEYDKPAAAQQIVNILVQAGIGVNPQTLTDAVVAIEDATGNIDDARDVALLLMRIMQAPQSQLDQIYLDGIDMTSDKGLDLTIEEFAKRYAKYKVKRNTPVTNWAYGDEQRERREKSYVTRFKKLTDKAVKTRGSDEQREFLEFLDEYKATGKTIRELKSGLNTARQQGDVLAVEEYAGMIEDLTHTPEYQRYASLHGAMSAWEKVSKQLKNVDSTNRDSVEDAMLSIRRGIVEELRRQKEQNDNQKQE